MILSDTLSSMIFYYLEIKRLKNCLFKSKIATSSDILLFIILNDLKIKKFSVILSHCKNSFTFKFYEFM